MPGLLSALLGADVAHTDAPTHHSTSFAGGEGLEFREYYAEACPHCKHLEPAWKAAAGKYSGPVTWRAIECNDDQWKPVEANSELCQNIPGFPTMKMFKGDKELDEYMGGRSADELLKYATEFDESKVEKAFMHPALALFATEMVRSVFGEKEDDKPKTPKEFL